MSELSSEQFRAAIAAAISGVEHLYREVDLLIAQLREELTEEPEPLSLKRGTLGKSGKRESKRVVVHYEYGALFEPSADDDEDMEEDEDGDEEEETEDLVNSAGKRRGRKGRHEILAAQPLLAMRIAMYDPRGGPGFEPQLQFAVMSDWMLGDSPAQADDRFSLQAYMLKRVPKALTGLVGVAAGSRIRTGAVAQLSSGRQKGKVQKLTCSLPTGVEATSLYSIDSAQAIEKLAEKVKGMWASVLGG